MSKRAALAALASASAAFGLLAAVSGTPPGPRAAASGQAAPTWALRFAPREGRTLVYALAARTAVDGKDVFGRDLAVDIRADGELRLDIRRVTTELVQAALSSPGIRVGLSGPGLDESRDLRADPDRPVLASFDRSGRLLELRNAEALEEANPLNFSIGEVLRACFPPLPAVPVALGGSWIDRKTLKVPYREMLLEIALESRLTLDQVLQTRDGSSAMISATYRLSLSGGRPLEDGIVAEFKGRGDGSGSLTFFADEGTLGEYRMNYALSGTMAARRDGKTLIEWPFRLSFAGALERLGRD